MRACVLGTALLFGFGSAPLARQASGPEPIVQVGVFSSNADGRDIGAAYDTEPDLSSTVYVGRTLCHLGAGNRQPPSDAIGAWRFSARVISRTPEEAVVQVTWQRLLENGAPVHAAETSVQLTLLAGERVPIDTVAPLSESSCQAITAAFEARYMARPFPVRTRTFGTRGGAAAGDTSGLSGTGRASAGEGRGTAAGGATREPRAQTRLFDVDLWLVRSAPGREDSVVHQVLRVTEQGASFAFAPITIETPSGPASLQVTGVFAVPGSQRFIFTTSRTIRFGRSGQPPRDQIPTLAGSSRIIDRMPGPDEVLSFEMPPVQLNEGYALPDQFSVRVRVTPIQLPVASCQLPASRQLHGVHTSMSPYDPSSRVSAPDQRKQPC